MEGGTTFFISLELDVPSQFQGIERSMVSEIKAAPFLLAPANDGLRLTTTPLRGELAPDKGSRKRDDRGEWLMPMLLPKGFGLVRCPLCQESCHPC